MPGRALQQTDKLLEALHGAGVPFVVVGGVAAIAHGAATSTKDLDIVMSMRVEDMRRLMDVLAHADQLIEVKAHTGRRKDLIVEQELRAIRAIRGAREP